MAAIQTLGIAGMRPAAPAPRTPDAGPDLAEYGAPGTPIFGGFLRERGEYNPELSGLQAISTYEQMRRSDAQVAATLLATKLPIRSAQWDVVAPEDASPVEAEATEFVRQCFFEDLDFPAVLRNALLMLDFGVAVHEDVWEPVGNRIRLKKLAPRLPLTFYRWITNENGEDLAALEQLGYRGSEYVCVQVPADKLAVFTFEQEGQNYTGRSLLRAMYQSWYIKSNLYRVDAIACERNGMGVPVITMGPSPKVEDIRTANAWVQSLIAHERTGLVLPPEWKFELVGVTGQIRNSKDSLAHHNIQISMAGLAMFLLLGQQTSSGNRALGDTMADFFQLGLEATAKQVARTLNLTSVRRLCDFNFAGLTRYPKITPQQILAVKYETIVSTLKNLATAGVVEPDDKLESWMREKMGAPEAEKATARPKAAIPGVGGGTPGADRVGPENAKSGVSNGEKKAAAGEPPLPAAKAEPSAADKAMPKAAMSDQMRRAPGTMGSAGARRAEKCVAFSEIAGELDRGRDEIAGALRGARSRVQAEIVHKLMGAPVARLHRVSIEPDAKLTAEIEGILRRLYDYGTGQVGEERARQRKGAAPGDAATVRLAETRPKRDALGVYADATVSEWQNNLTARAANVALDYRRRQGNLTAGEVIRAIEDELDGQSDKWMDGVASKGANEAFADGREAGYEEYADEIASVIYSALLDINTCGACAEADGSEGATPDDIPAAPNPDCDGGDKCRCVHVYVFADEGGK